MNTVKITKKDYFNAIMAMTNGEASDISADNIVAFCEKEIAALDQRAVKAKERAAAKRAEGDELQNLVLSVLTDEPATRVEVFDRVVATGEADAEVSLAKVGYRLTALCGAEKAVKTEVVVTGEDGKNKKLAAYSLA